MAINRRDLIAFSAVALGGIAVADSRATEANSKGGEVLKLWPTVPPGAAGPLPQEHVEERIQGGVTHRRCSTSA